MRFVRGMGLVLMIAMVPLALITTSARIVIQSGWLYNYGFDTYEIPRVTGIEKPELMRVADEIKTYFTNDAKELDVRIVRGGVERPLFNAREIHHMVDVKGMMQRTQLLQQLSLGYLAAFAIAAIWAKGKASLILGRGIFWGCVATVALILVAGLGSLVAFEPLFILFHELSFSNDLWLLDPRTDYLLMMFPEGFFLDATLCIAGLSIAGAILAGTASWGGLRRAGVGVRPTATG